MTERMNESGEKALARRISLARAITRLVMMAEQVLPLLIAPLSVLSLFLSAAWFGLFRSLPDLLRLAVSVVLVFCFLVSLLPLWRLRRPEQRQIDQRLEAENELPHQAVSLQSDQLVSATPFAKALWERHRRDMAMRIGALRAGWPAPDISRFDASGLRAVPALVFAIALSYSFSGQAGRVSDAFSRRQAAEDIISARQDIWITPPAYTRKPALTVLDDGKPITVPRFSELTVRLSTDESGEAILFTPANGNRAVALEPVSKQAGQPTDGSGDGLTYKLKLDTAGTLQTGHSQVEIALIPDEAPRIAFDGKPKRTVTGALEIRFKGQDDYGIESARADIVPLDQPPQAQPLYPLPEFPLDVTNRAAGEMKGVSSRNLTEHPLAGKRVRITLVAVDAAGQTGRSDPIDILLPARDFSVPLAAAVAEQRQVFALDVRHLPKAIEYNDALMLRAEENIPKIAHYLLLKSARARMLLARDETSLKDAADYLWEIALGIDGGDLPLAERAVRDAQKALADALKRNASEAEIKALMDNLRKAMNDYMQALAQRMDQQKPGQQTTDARNAIRQQDLERMLNQLENMARSGNREAAQKLLSDMQRLMNNLQAGGTPREPSQAEKQAREQVDKLGKILRDQQKLMEETYKLNKQLEQQQWQTDPGIPGQDEPLDPLSDDQATDPGAMTQEQKQAMQNLQKRQRALEKQLQELGEGLKGLGMKPNKGLDQAGREMEGAGKALGRGEGQPAIDSQGRALEALRKGAQEMMQSMAGKGEGQGNGMSQTGPGSGGGMRDPLGRSNGSDGLGDYGGDKLPDTTDVQRARDILDAIRKKLGETDVSPTGRQYLERLLNLD